MPLTNEIGRQRIARLRELSDPNDLKSRAARPESIGRRSPRLAEGTFAIEKHLDGQHLCGCFPVFFGSDLGLQQRDRHCGSAVVLLPVGFSELAFPLVLSLTRMGDIIQSIPFFRRLRLKHPQSEIHILVEECFRDVASMVPCVDKIHSVTLENLLDRQPKGVCNAES